MPSGLVEAMSLGEKDTLREVGGFFFSKEWGFISTMGRLLRLMKLGLFPDMIDCLIKLRERISLGLGLADPFLVVE